MEKLAGTELTTEGGIISFFPPDIGDCTAQAANSINKDKTAIPRNNLGIRRNFGLL